MFYSEEQYREYEDERLGLGEPAYVVGGQPCGSYEEACEVAGIETPAQLEAEARYYEELNRIVQQDAMEARGGPEYRFADPDFDEIPF